MLQEDLVKTVAGTKQRRCHQCKIIATGTAVFMLAVTIIIVVTFSVIYYTSSSGDKNNCYHNTPTQPEDGSVTVLNSTEGVREAVYSCQTGFYLEGQERRECVNGTWEGERPKCTACRSSYDIVFILDSSFSILSEDFIKAKKFLQELVKSLSNNFRFGLVRFGNPEMTQSMFYFNTYPAKNKSQISSAIGDIAHIVSGTDMQSALNETCVNQFTLKHGDRPNVPNAAIILTDGDFFVPYRILKKMHNSGVNTFAIGIGTHVNKKKIKLLSFPQQILGENYFLPVSFDTLASEVALALTRSICQS